MNRIKLNILSPWPVLITLVMFVSFISVVALGSDDDPIVGYTHDGIPVYESELPDGDVQLGQALGLRQLDINIKDIQKIKTEFISSNMITLTIDDVREYNIVFGDCSINDIDNFQFQTRGDGKLDVGDFAIVRRNPFKYFDNPNLVIKKILRSSLSDLICKGVEPKYYFISGSGDKKRFSKKNLSKISNSLKEKKKKKKIKIFWE